MTSEQQVTIPEHLLSFVKSKATISNYFIRVWKDDKCFAIPFGKIQSRSFDEACEQLCE